MKFQTAYEATRDSVYGYLLYMTRDKQLAQDLSQETFLKMFLHMGILQEALREAYKESNGDWFMEADNIWIHYPKRYGHDYYLHVRIIDGHIYIRKGYNEKQEELITFYEDNGLVSYCASFSQDI